MLSENLQELLSAYVDGELDSNEYERVMATLRDSDAARKYVADLRSISENLKSLPGYSFPQKNTQQFLIKQKLAKRQSYWRTMGTAGSIAAGLLVAISAWWMLSKPAIISQNPVQSSLVRDIHQKQVKDVQSPIVAKEPKATFEFAPYVAMAQEALAQGYDGLEGFNRRFAESVNWLAQAESVRQGKFLDHQANVLTGPLKNMGSFFKTLNRPLPVMLSVTDYSLDKIKSHIQPKDTFVFDLSSRDNIKSMNRLLEAGKQIKMPIAVDSELQHRLDKNLSATFMIYLENLTESQFKDFLQAMEKVDYWNQTELKNASSVTSMLLYPLDESGRSQVVKSLGLNQDQLGQNGGKKNNAGIALSYFSFRLPQTLSENVRKATARLGGTAPDRLSLVIMVRSTR